MVDADHRERLVRIETQLEHQGRILEKIDGKMDAQDERLRGIEKKTATHASVAGAVVSLGVSLIAARLTGKS